MELAAFVVQAVLVEGRSVREVARAHGVSKTWLYELCARYRGEGEAGLVARSKRPHRSPIRVAETVEDEIVAIRKQLTDFGVEAGPDTIHTHLTQAHGGIAPCSVSSVWRILTRRGFITPEPHKRPRSSYIRFEAELPNECWQTDVTHVALKNGRSVEVLNVIDDHSRLCLTSRAFPVTTAADVVTIFYEIAQQYGFPTSVLSNNGAIFTASFRGDRGALATELAQRGIVFKHSRPYHPQTCGKVERFHQTTKKYLAANPAARSLAAPNPTRRLRHLLQRRTPPPSQTPNDTPHRLRRPRQSQTRGNADPRRRRIPYPTRPRRPNRQSHPALRRATPPPRHRTSHRGQHVLMLIHDRDVRVLTTDGHHIAEHRMDPDRIYQPKR